MDFTKVGIVSDIKVKVKKPCLVYPAEVTERRSMFLSNIDQVLVFTVETVHFFGPNPQTSFEDVVNSVKSALSRLLVHYDFMAGRLSLNTQQGRFEIDCNGAGVAFATASSQLSMEDLEDITYPNPAFKQLVLQGYHVKTVQDQPVCAFQSWKNMIFLTVLLYSITCPLNERKFSENIVLQMTEFKCGGFTIGLGTNHTVLDGISAVHFLQNLASMASGQGLALTPFSDRTLLKARSPPRIEYSHPELIKLEEIAKCPTPFTKRVDDISDCTDFSSHLNPSTTHIFKLFHISADMLYRIKAKALRDGKLNKCTGFEAVTSHLWQTRTIALEMQPDENSTVLFAVDMRSRMKPRLPREYAGNAVFPAYANTRAKDMEEQPLSACVQKLQEGVGRMTDAYLRSCIDWGEIYKGIPRTEEGSMFVSSWWRLGFEEIEYPWGKPLYSGPVVHERVDIVLFLPNQRENGVNVFLALDARRMAKFEKLFMTV
eukprot:Gb_31500 [translate_table: standard]